MQWKGLHRCFCCFLIAFCPQHIVRELTSGLNNPQATQLRQHCEQSLASYMQIINGDESVPEDGSVVAESEGQVGQVPETDEVHNEQQEHDDRHSSVRVVADDKDQLSDT